MYPTALSVSRGVYRTVSQLMRPRLPTYRLCHTYASALSASLGLYSVSTDETQTLTYQLCHTFVRY